MLTLRLTPYSSTTWTYDKGSYRTSDSTSAVAPYEHPLLEHLHVTDGERTLVIVRERVAERAVCEPGPRSLAPAMYDQAREAALRVADRLRTHRDSTEPPSPGNRGGRAHHSALSLAPGRRSPRFMGNE